MIIRWPLRKKPTEGYWRLRHKYAWLPVRVTDRTVIWLNRYRVYDRFRSGSWQRVMVFWDWQAPHRNWHDVTTAFWQLYVALGNIMLNRYN